MEKSVIGKVILIISIYLLGLFLILHSLYDTMLTLSGSVERELGWDPLSFDIFIYLFRFEIPSLSVQFFSGMLLLVFGFFLNFKLRKRRNK